MNAKTGDRVTGHITNKAAGRVEFTGTVTVVYLSNGQSLVNVDCEDGIERTARAENLTPVKKTTSTASNLMTHTGRVHAPGRSFKQLRGGLAPKCCASASALARYHFITPTSQHVDCMRCLALLAKEQG